MQIHGLGECPEVSAHDGDHHTDFGITGEVWETEADSAKNMDVRRAFRQVSTVPGRIYGLSEEEMSRTVRVGPGWWEERRRRTPITCGGGIRAWASCVIDLRSLPTSLVALDEVERVEMEEILAGGGRIRDGGRGMEEPVNDSSGQVGSV